MSNDRKDRNDKKVLGNIVKSERFDQFYAKCFANGMDFNSDQANAIKAEFLSADGEIAKLRARVAELEAGQHWQPASTAPKDGKFLIGVWLGDWNNPQQSFVVMEARFFQGAIYWEKNDWRYRTEEGGAYDVVGWMPRPQSPEGGKA